MLGNNIDDKGWPACGEIDIMENVGFDPDRIYLVIHTQTNNGMSKNQKSSSIIVLTPYADFHVYAIEWFEDKIDFYVDDQKCFTFKNEGTGWEKWPFDQKQYLIINAAVGGTLGGMHGIDDSIFPQKFYIDYVRVFKNSISLN
jgi:beta-glucanase (GH16 family)